MIVTLSHYSYQFAADGRELASDEEFDLSRPLVLPQVIHIRYVGYVTYVCGVVGLDVM